MSIETDFQALLEGYAPLAALVDDRIAQDAVPEGDVYPLVVYSARHDYITAMDGTRLKDQCTLSTQCWGSTGTEAASVADAVLAAVATAPASASVVVVDRSNTFDEDLGLDGVVLTITWWA